MIREMLGFDGLLMTDDLSMKALCGAFEDRARRRCTPAATWSCTATATWTRCARCCAAAASSGGRAPAPGRARRLRRIAREVEPLDEAAARARFAAAFPSEAGRAGVSEAFQPSLDFDAVAEAVEDGEVLVVDLDGWEGPLHVLLALARTQKVDLLRISITRLADQYLAFVQRRAPAAVLAGGRLSGDGRLAGLPEVAPAAAQARAQARATSRRRRTWPPRWPSAWRSSRPCARRARSCWRGRGCGVDVFTRGDPEATVIVPVGRLEASVYDLMAAYVAQRKRESGRRYAPTKRVEAYPLEDARDRLRQLLPRAASAGRR